MPAAGFKDANDASETQRVMNVLTEIAQTAEVLVVAVDHFGKDVSTGTRNSSVKEDSVDAVLALLADRDLAGKVENQRLAIRKVRGAPTGQEIHFETRRVTVGENSGTEIHTLVVDWIKADDPTAPKPKAARWPKSLIIFRRALEFALTDTGQRMRPFTDGPEVLAAKRDVVRAEFMRIYPADSRKAKGEAFRRCERDAVTGRLITSREVGVENADTYFWLLGTGM
jgi:hypothetical protein